MIRALVFFAVLFAVAFGFAWMADLPGVVSVSWQGYVWEQPPVVAAVLIGLALVLVLLAFWLVGAILRSPRIARRFLRRRRRDKGYEALSHGLIALGTGNAKRARRYGQDADKLLRGESAARLLLAQAAQMSGQHDEARQRFEAMLKDPETRALGLHGLFIEAERQNEPIAARHYAEEAARAVPGLDWAGRAVLGYQAVAGDWEAAIATLERNYAARLVDKKTYRRHRAVLLAARALELEDGDPETALTLAKEAHGLALDLVPAAVVAARLATRKGDVRKAAKIVEATWRLSPHPDLADAYAHARIGDAALDRLARVRTLAAQRAHTAEGALAVARAALEAREFGEAREQLKRVLRSEPTRGAFVLMAELEEAEHGDRGRVREWLARAVRAPLDKAWVADGVVREAWAPVSPVTGRLDAFEWTTPTGLPETPLVEALDDALFEAPALTVRPAAPKFDTPAEVPPAAGAAPEPAADAAVSVPAAEPEPDVAASASSVASPPVGPAADRASSGGAATAVEPAAVPAAATPPAASVPSAALPVQPATAEKAGDRTGGKAASEAGVNGADQPITLPLGRMPDDPGTDEEDDQPKPPGPRFFN
ncbi:heme biosynthesis protein HemY [Polymorphum gilvum]|uniref:HemY N-terminal domain protein n=1 Tax=Polymorphum gilvum (strain LMG 25793 / CGMCC 1.9160 / SL003B-26A1) TaxID=991905 RepID=F2J254_POLGS|nr:heme biosynthesis HemY N-terminal domain-containing protein [Polymorphum gilvum]ADZ68813.1 HemY N-terminal domain protein [Polymorphum gilvum SL003B-26A1]